MISSLCQQRWCALLSGICDNHFGGKHFCSRLSCQLNCGLYFWVFSPSELAKPNEKGVKNPNFSLLTLLRARGWRISFPLQKKCPFDGLSSQEANFSCGNYHVWGNIVKS
ncbi:hypothetical protein SETIT_5G336400v2 [Setaria italica]|uniref:Uncharacterized protein n=1 Tax=Setaria italica TaxID=4555 RepID=A0A368RBY0_SETIT|nr:hypothetical protein SETIT_5G336400v2 [Setaria italica]